MHNQDIQELLDHIQDEIISIFEQVKKGTINKVSVKNTLENLRSILDYAAQDMQEKLKTCSTKKTPEKVYFPYGHRDNHFNKSIKRNLPGLSEHLPEVYSLVIAMQPFKSGDSWLVDLCGLTNDAKHNNLSKTENQKSRVISQGGMALVKIGAGTELRMSGNRVNGVLQDDVHIAHDGKTTIRAVSGETLITENNKIQFQGKHIEVAPFLGKCHQNLIKFVESLEKELENS